MTTPTFVLVPGLGSDAAVWRRTIAALRDAAGRASYGWGCLPVSPTAS